MKGKGQVKRSTEEATRLLLSSRYAAGKEKNAGPMLIRPMPRTSKHVAGLHFEFPETSAPLSRVTNTHRRVNSTEAGWGQWGAQLLRVYSLIRTAYPNVPEVQDMSDDNLVLQHIEAGVVLIMSQLKAKEQEADLLLSRIQSLSKSSQLEQQREQLQLETAALKQTQADFERQKNDHRIALQKREEELEIRERELRAAVSQLEKDRVGYAAACAKMRKRVREAERQVQKLQSLQAFSAKSSEVQSKLKNIVKQESMLNAVAEDLQYQRSSLLAKLETTLTEIAPPSDADSSKTADESEVQSDTMEGVLKDCSNLLSTRETRCRSKGSTQDSSRLYRTLSRDRPVDIMEIYTEIEEERKDPLDLTPKDVLTPKSQRSSRSLFEDA